MGQRGDGGATAAQQRRSTTGKNLQSSSCILCSAMVQSCGIGHIPRRRRVGGMRRDAKGWLSVAQWRAGSPRDTQGRVAGRRLSATRMCWLVAGRVGRWSGGGREVVRVEMAGRWEDGGWRMENGEQGTGDVERERTGAAAGCWLLRRRGTPPRCAQDNKNSCS